MFIAYYSMLKEKRIELASAANKLRNGLSKIDETREKVEVMSVELEVAQAQGKEFFDWIVIQVLFVVFMH